MKQPHPKFVVCSLMLAALGASILAGFGVVHAASQIYDGGVVKGQEVIRIQNVDHDVEHVIGRPDGRTVTEQLRLAGVAVAAEDRINMFPDPALGLGSAIVITRATPITIVDGKKSIVAKTWVATVSDALAEQKIELGKDDTIDKGNSDPLVKDMTIKITRVQVTELQEKEQVAFSKTTVDDATMEKGVTKVIQVGKAGVRTKTYRVRREDGVEVERKLVKNEVTTDPITEKTAVGTKVVVYASGQATWYGTRHGMGAAHNTLPFGTKVHVVNLTNGKSVDVTINDRGIRGSAIIDLNAEAFQLIAPLGAGRINVRLEKYYGN